MELKDCILNRRSIRRYSNRPVTREQVEQIVSLASYAPSWKNTQVARYIAITDHSLIEKLASECVLGFTHNADILRSCSVLVIQSIVNKRSGYERDGSFSTTQGTHWESFDAGLAAQTFCLAAQELGIGTCILGIFDEVKTAEALSLPEGQTVSCMIPMGFPAEEPNAPKRKEVSKLLRWIE